MPVKRYTEQTDRNRCYYFDDFGGAAYDNRTWAVAGSAGGSATKIAAIGGQVRVTTAASVGSVYYLFQQVNQNFNVSGPCEITWYTKIEDITFVSDIFGFFNASENILLLFDPTVSANWLAQCQDSVGVTQVDTGWRVDAGVWIKLQILTSTTAVRFFINGSLRTTISTNITTLNLGPMIELIRQTGGSGTRSALIDWVEAIGGRAT